MGMDVLECCMKHLPKTFCLISVLLSGQMFGSVIDSLRSAVLLLHDLYSHLWICYCYLLISLSCGIFCNCVKHNYSASDLEGNVITEQQDS